MKVSQTTKSIDKTAEKPKEQKRKRKALSLSLEAL
jgi:hypothetical protein